MMKMKCRWPFIGALTAVLYLVASWVFMWPPVMREAPRHTRACINNLRLMDMAKEQWAAKHGQTNGAPVVIAEADQWIKGGQTPICPSGGTYAYRRVGEKPTCSLGQSKPTKVRVSAFSYEWSPSRDHQMNPW